MREQNCRNARQAANALRRVLGAGVLGSLFSKILVLK